jgi:DNA-binding transcriptional LysR family regulator
MYDVGKLITLRAVVVHGSFSAAGQAMQLTQPAVPRQIALLERQAGTQLVRRTRHGVRATEAARHHRASVTDVCTHLPHTSWA